MNKSMKDIDKISFSFILSAIGNLIGFRNNEITTPTSYDKYWTEYVIFNFINNGGLTNFNPSDYKLSSEYLFLLATIKSIKHKNYLDTLKNNYIETFKFIQNDQFERNLDIITKNSITKIIKKEEITYDDNANSSFAIVRSLPFGLIYKNNQDIITKSIETTGLTHQNGFSIIGGIVVSLITKYAFNKVPIKKWIENAIDDLGKIDFKEYKYSKIYLDSKEKYLDKLNLYLERSINKSKALIYPSIRSEFYHRNFNQGKTLYYGNKTDDSIIIAYDCLMDCIIYEKPSFEKLIYLSCLNLGESSILGMLSCFWYGLYFGYTDDIPKSLFLNIENMNDILNIKEQL